MASLKAKILLKKLAKKHKQQKEYFSKEEIAKKINELKYLSAQKNVPRLSLRKEILQLEEKLSGIFEMEKQLVEHKQHESVKMSSLRKQMEGLKKRLAVCDDDELQEKIEKLSYLLANYVAKSKTQEDVELSQRIIREMQDISTKKKKLDEDKERKEKLRVKLTELKLYLNRSKRNNVSPGKVKILEDRIIALEQKLGMPVDIPRGMPTMPVVTGDQGPNVEIKHEMLFGPNAIQVPEKEEEETEELPLPPPPRVTKRK